MVNTPLLELKNLGFSHGPHSIFSHVDLGVQPGETLCLLGPNGSGKTTLLDCILGIHPPKEGEILLKGRPLSAMAPEETARIMAYVPQHHHRHFAFSVLDVLLTGRTPYTRFYGGPSAEDRNKAMALLARLNLEHLAERDYTRLSGGETQLVMILRALVQETPAILMDEPTAHLDFRNELMVLETMARLIRDKGLTLVMATHFPNHAFYLERAGLSVKVAFLDHGRLHMAGPPSRALTRENLARYYQVETRVLSSPMDQDHPLKQIIPLYTLSPGKTPHDL